MAEIDETTLINQLLPKSWRCPHCGKRNRMDPYAEEIFLEFFQVIRQCPSCGFLHIWHLKLTEEFKKKIIDLLLKM
jgi:rubredoxin